MKFNQVTLFGASGLIGSYLLKYLLKDSEVHLINIISRKPFYLKHDKINNIVIDFTDLNSFSICTKKSDAVFVSIGTTMAKVNGNKSEYRKIDFDIIFNIAKACKKNSVKNLLFVSSLGADSNASSFYLSLKGDIEDAVEKLKLTSTSIFRPSVLLGNRNEARFMERIAQIIMSYLIIFIPSKYKPIDADIVAKSMVNTSKNPKPGFNLYHYKEIKDQLLN
ncbi:MAG: Uncharacterised protein [Polaribacter sp. SA4-10]|nr:MAG: Uncharacterised protein [Polaribacter sp. SA4-10]|tara:strand:- start:922 stop:1584 length:663 start_codon:yes stop_codon:yes gene_type:complete